MFFYFLCLFCSIDDKGVDFESCTVKQRKITLKLKGYYFSVATKIYLKGKNFKEEVTIQKDRCKTERRMVSFDVPDKVKDTFSIIITTKLLSIIYIEEIKIDTTNNILKTPSTPLKIHCRHLSSQNELKETLDKFLKGEEQKTFSFDNYPVIRYLIKGNSLFLDTKDMPENVNKKTSMSLQNGDISDSVIRELTKKNIEFISSDVSEYFPKTTATNNFKNVLKIKNLKDLIDVERFYIKIEIDNEVYFIERFIKRDEYESELGKVYMIKEKHKAAFDKEYSNYKLNLNKKEETEKEEESREKWDEKKRNNKKKKLQRYLYRSDDKSKYSINDESKVDTPKIDNAGDKKSSKEVVKEIPSKKSSGTFFSLSFLEWTFLIFVTLLVAGFAITKYLS